MKTVVKIPKDADLPLIGLVQVGIIDRGTNLLQVRATTVCNLNCIFCSTDAGPFSKYHTTDYTVDLPYLVEWIKEMVKFKGGAHVFLDSVGEVLTYPSFLDLVSEVSQLKGVESVAIETNGTLLKEEIIDELEELNLSRINLSLHALDDKLNKFLTGCQEYDTSRILEIIKYITKSKIDLTLTPVWVPGLNDGEIPKLIDFAKGIKNRKYPVLGIQKYEVHRFGRKPKGVKAVTWYKFYKKLEELEKVHGIKLILTPADFEIKKAKMLPLAFKVGETATVEVKAKGWMPNEMIGTAKNRCITLVDCKAPLGKILRAKILRNKHNIYIGR
jgi:uncharacterized Fe-S cluster-containing radical SAM superfamily enzyme